MSCKMFLCPWQWYSVSTSLKHLGATVTRSLLYHLHSENTAWFELAEKCINRKGFSLCTEAGFNRFTSDAVKTRNLFFNRGSADVLTRIPFFCEFGREPCQHATRGRDIVQDDVYTYMYKCFLESEGTRNSVAPEKRHCRQWMSSLFIHDLFLWRTTQEFVKTDLYPSFLTSLRYAVCLTRCWSILLPLLRSLSMV